MAWKKLTVDDLRQALAEDEITALNSISLDPAEVDQILQKQLDTVADAFRGAISAKGYPLDIRDQYLPGSVCLYALTLARYYIWTRLPMSPAVALDEARKTLFENAQKQLEKFTLGVEKPDWEHDPENPENSQYASSAKVRLPFLRMNDSLFWWTSKKDRCGC